MEEHGSQSFADRELRIDRWIVGDRVLGPDGRERAWALAIRQGRIIEIRAAEGFRARDGLNPSNHAPAVTDYRRRPIVPAWVNSHTHLAMAPLRGIADRAARQGNVVQDVFFSIESHLTARDVYVFSKLGAFESLLLGVAEVWDHYYHGAAVARALGDAGLAGVVAPTLQDRSGPGREHWQRALDATRSISAQQSERPWIRPAIGLHASDTVSDELLERASVLARELEAPVHMHVAQSAEEMEAAERDGRDVAVRLLEHLGSCRVLAAHGCWLGREQIDELVEAGWTLAFCPLSQVQFGILAPLAAWVRAGGQWSIGTDCVASNDALDVQRELPWAPATAALEASYSTERRELFMTADPTLRTAAQRQAEAKRSSAVAHSSLQDATAILPASWGPQLERSGPGLPGIRVGNWAHLQVLDGEHPALFPSGLDQQAGPESATSLSRTLCFGHTAGAIHQLIVAGKDVGEAGNYARSILSSAEYLHLRAEANKLAEELFNRAGLAAGGVR